MWLCMVFSFHLLQIAFARNAGDDAIRSATPSVYAELYDQINSYLGTNVEQSYGDYNMRAAIDWLATLRASSSNQPLVAALELLTSLTKLKQDAKCSRDSYSILLANYLATGNLKLHYKLTNTKRIENLVYFYCFQHAKQCKYIYAHNYETKYRNMDKRLVGYVEAFLNPIMYSDKYSVDEYSDKMQIYTHLLSKQVSIRGPLEAEVSFDTLKKLAENNSKRDSLTRLNQNSEGLRKDKIRELFDKYLVSPCDYYIKQLGPDIFYPIAFDDLFQDTQEKLDHPKTDFYHSWARFRFCEALIKNDQESLFLDMIKIAEKTNN